MPDWAGIVRARLAALSLAAGRESDIVEELSQHLEQRYDELRNRGLSDADAHKLAVDELLDGEALGRQLLSLRQARTAAPLAPGAPGRALLDDLRDDLRYTARLLRKQPGFAAAAIVMLALGIGATTTIFSVVNGVLIKPLPYPQSDALVSIVHAIGGVDQPYFSDAVYLTYVDNTQAFQDVGVWTPGATATITGRGDPEEVRALSANQGLLSTLGVEPALGRALSKNDDAPGAPEAAMLTHGYWQRAFGGDPSVVDRSIAINGRLHRIVGVLPAGFRFGDEFELVLPLRIDRGAPIASFRLLGVARLKPGVTLAQANADAGRILRVWLTIGGQTDPAFQARYQPSVRPLKQDVVGDVGRTLWILLAAIGIVLLMACANIANLLMVRADARRHEFAIRAALGARWTRVARQLLVETLTLALLGGAAGVALAYAGLRALTALGPANLPRLADISIDGVVLAFALGIAGLSGLLFGLIPIARSAQPRLAGEVGAGGRGVSLTRERQRSQQALVALQIALALVMLVSAGLMIRSFSALQRVAPGFVQPERVQTFTISIPPTMLAEPERVARMQHDVLDRVAAIPGVRSAAFTTRVPMGGDRSSSALRIEGRADDRRTPPNRQVKVVSPGVFDTLGTALVAGRDFTWTDVDDRREVAIVSENLARETWGSPDAALGKRVREYYSKDSPWREVVGVAGDVHDDGAHQPAPATIYWPAHPDEALMGMDGYQSRRVTIVARTDRAGTEGLLRQVQEAVWSVNAHLPLADVRTLDTVFAQSLARTSFTLVMLGVAGSMALLLGVSGLYGVIAYAVSRRRREIGIRLALGAGAREIRALFVRRGLLLVVVGLAIGLGGAVGVTRVMRSLLFGVGPLDPVAFTVMPIVLAASAMLASYLPARRALRVDPVETLREE